ncbi:MAG: CehA/McbA family metallohydrolase [bacterium]
MRTIVILATITFIILLTQPALAYEESHIQKNIMPLRQPEILSDAPQRIEKGFMIPVLLIIRHADLFPVALDTVTFSVMFDGGKHLLEKRDYHKEYIVSSYWHEVYEIMIPDGFAGTASIDVEFEIEMNGKKKSMHNNNFPKSGRRLLEVYISGSALPSAKNWYFGDTHFHTAYTDNQVEFGAPLEVSARMARAYGLRWLAITDHSFDLDDYDGDSANNDPDLKKWKKYKEEIKYLSRIYPDIALIRGEEVSCGNSLGQNVHLLALNHDNFMAGNGDGYEGPNTPDFPCKHFFDNLEPKSVAYAAHPFSELDALSTYILNRGHYTDEDLTHPNLSGMEFWNGSVKPDENGYKKWISLLLSGARTFIAAGSDAHGDFQTTFGAVRTAVFVPDAPDPDSIAAALRNGNSIVSSGPFISLSLTNEKNETAVCGESISGSSLTINLAVISSPEFGALKKLQIIAGDLDAKNETTILQLTDENQFQSPFKHDIAIQIQNLNNFYIRAEAETARNNTTFYALTNPIWGKLE